MIGSVNFQIQSNKKQTNIPARSNHFLYNLLLWNDYQVICYEIPFINIFNDFLFKYYE
jgi:hypothetical protein